MPIRPPLVRSIPFWVLVVASVAMAIAGAFIVVDTLGSMTSKLTDMSATNIDVYVGPSVALTGAVLLGAGLLGILLSLAVAAAATLRPVHAAAEELDIDIDTEEPVEEAPVVVVAEEPVVVTEAPSAEDTAGTTPTR